MSDDNSQKEPSMEEILSSIRKVISEDNDENRKVSPDEQEILELTDVVVEGALEDKGSTYNPESLPVTEPIAVDKSEKTEEPLVSSAAEAITTAALLQLKESLAGNEVPLGRADKTLEQLVKELMRPMLRIWLEENLPLVVEDVVKREVNRLANTVEMK